jgi:hypothetical protein
MNDDTLRTEHLEFNTAETKNVRGFEHCQQ